MTDYLNIAGRIRTTASDGVSMEASEVFDESLEKSQSEINNDVNEIESNYLKQGDGAAEVSMATVKRILDQDDNQILPVTSTNAVVSPDGTSTIESRMQYVEDHRENAYEIAVRNGFVGTEQEWLNSLKATIGEFKFIEYDSDAPSTIGDTATTISGITASADTMSKMLLMPNDASSPTATRMYVTNQSGTSYVFVYNGDLNIATNFGSGQAINEVSIIDDLKTGGANNVLSAKQGKVIKETYGSYIDCEEFVEAHTDSEGKFLYGVKKDGDFHFGKGIPSQIAEVIDAEIERAIDVENTKADADDVYTKTESDSKFVEQESGKSLIDEDFASSQGVVFSEEYLQAVTDSDNKLLEGIRLEGEKEFDIPTTHNKGLKIKESLDVNGFKQATIDNPEYLELKIDSDGRLMEGIKKAGVKEFGVPVEIGGNRFSSNDNSEFLYVETDAEGRILSATKKNGNHYVRNLESETIDEINETLGNMLNGNGSLKVVVSQDNSFYIRYHIDDANDGILTLTQTSTNFQFHNNCMMQCYFYVGSNTQSDEDILGGTRYQNVNDTISTMITGAFGPIFANHGYATPRVRALKSDISTYGIEVGSEWYDTNPTTQETRYYTISHIRSYNSTHSILFLVPKMHTGTPGSEYADWKYGDSFPTTLSRSVGGTTQTISVSNGERWDYQMATLDNVRVEIDGNVVGEGTYYCNEITFSYRQIGYNPITAQIAWTGDQPTPVWNDIMLTFDRTFFFVGGTGSLSLTHNTVVNNYYPFVLSEYKDNAPMLPFGSNGYNSHIFIPKLKGGGDQNPSATDYIDFSEEFISDDASHSSVHFLRRSADLVDVDDMPDRIYSYQKNPNNGNILFGCAGGKSLVNGMSVKSVRNNWIPMNGPVVTFYTGNDMQNKFYCQTLIDTGETNNILPALFIGEFESYMCWYKPKDDIHVFYHKSADCYVVYIHTNKSFAKGAAILPDFMNGMGVASTVEKTNGISMLTTTVVNGKLFFASDNTNTEYNYIVITLK